MMLCGGLFAAGGTHIEGIGGQKWLRRYGIPVYLAVIALLSHVLWYKALVVAIAMIGALSMGYGESKPYWYKFMVGFLWVAPTMILGFTWWQAITPVLWILIFFLSNWDKSAKEFKWKIVEFMAGVLIGITFINALG
jgi:hypothetical protein